MTALSYIFEHKIVAILRGIHPKDVLNIATALHKAGITIMEVTLNSSQALPVIEELSHTFKGRMLIGAGTVVNVAEAMSAIDAGAEFLISPTLDIDVIKTAKDHSVVSIPGAYTPTEILTAYKNGSDIIKVFPAQSPEYIRHILAPLNNIPVMPTGGVNLNNIHEYKNAGASAYGIGSSLVNNNETVDEAYLLNLTAKAKKFIEAIK
jgi:2-dehydro-3-deoxyphosphogluconate aldolase/(4S)-4-hydroxy-2-oxoglutarate aldolase